MHGFYAKLTRLQFLLNNNMADLGLYLTPATLYAILN